jgi:hypothetical protein
LFICLIFDIGFVAAPGWDASSGFGSFDYSQWVKIILNV